MRGFRWYDNIAQTRNVSQCLHSLYAMAGCTVGAAVALVSPLIQLVWWCFYWTQTTLATSTTTNSFSFSLTLLLLWSYPGLDRSSQENLREYSLYSEYLFLVLDPLISISLHCCMMCVCRILIKITYLHTYLLRFYRLEPSCHLSSITRQWNESHNAVTVHHKFNGYPQALPCVN